MLSRRLPGPRWPLRPLSLLAVLAPPASAGTTALAPAERRGRCRVRPVGGPATGPGPARRVQISKGQGVTVAVLAAGWTRPRPGWPGT